MQRPNPVPRAFRTAAAASAFLTATSIPAYAIPSSPVDWQPKEPPLSTRWTHEVGPGNALPDYPRPQMVRTRWQSLNGVWQYAGAAAPPPVTSEQILVPYPPESGLSGIKRHDDHMLYERTFDVPQQWRGQRVLLHFGAVDQKAEVRVNGRTVATHEGGYTGFSADITDALGPQAKQELVVAAEDRNDANPYPVGKQRNQPHGILYTGASGIWQSVWLEPVPAAHVTRLDVRPDVASKSFGHPIRQCLFKFLSGVCNGLTTLVYDWIASNACSCDCALSPAQPENSLKPKQDKSVAFFEGQNGIDRFL